NSFKALNVDDTIIEEVAMGSKVTTSDSDDEVDPVENETASFLAWIWSKKLVETMEGYNIQTLCDDFDIKGLRRRAEVTLEMVTRNKMEEACKGKNVTTSNIVSKTSGIATPNEASTSKGGNMVKTTNSFELLNSLEVDPTAHEEPSDPKDSTQRVCLGKSNVQVNEASENDVEEVYDETMHFMASKGTKEGTGIWK
ncbi:hypothetical protein Tco_1115662, partial [Tanacetum coccineum]